ncbi:MAG TPA: DUF4105 domain-containing protein [Dongiaceae bacterium]|nr:DUF4105 domain-containing protein [Dongiaceae bacterium]
MTSPSRNMARLPGHGGGLIPSLIRLLSGLGAALFWLILAMVNLWAVAALYIDLPGWNLIGAGLYVAIVLTAFFATPGLRLGAMAGTAGFAVILAWWLTLMPSDVRQWQADVDRTAWAEIASDNAGTTVTVHNVRNFDYRSETDYTPHWETRQYDLAKLQGIDLFLTYWGSPWIAHPILSFQFADSPPLAISVETRKEIGENYSAIRGFFRQYELIYILADERDVIRLRTNDRKGEEVYLYRTTVTAETARAVLLDYFRAVNALHQQPAFYNALTSNCTTNIRIHTAAATGQQRHWNWRLVLSGKIDEYVYDQGRLAGNLPFDELKRRVHINYAARQADHSPDFSALIRAERPGFP